MKKRFIAWLLILAALMSLAGCRQADAGEIAATDTVVEKNELPEESKPVEKEPEKEAVTEPAEKEPVEEKAEEPAPTPEPEPPQAPEFTGVAVEANMMVMRCRDAENYTFFAEVAAPESENKRIALLECSEDVADFDEKVSPFLGDYAGKDSPYVFDLQNLLKKEYNAKFFENNALVVLHFTSSSGSIRYSAQKVTKQENNMQFWIERKTPAPDSGMTCDMAGWLVAVEIPKQELAGIENYEYTVYDIWH